MSDDAIVADLAKIQGIGRWTVEMLLIFRLSRRDVFPAEDLGIVKAVRNAYNLRTTPNVQRLYRDRRAMAAVPVGCVVVLVGKSGESEIKK